MPRQRTQPAKDAAIPEKVRTAYDAIVAKTDAFCREHLTDEYAGLCRRLAEGLARARPSPITRGKIEGWAAGIVRAVGWVNFLGDPSQKPHMSTADIDKAFRISEATGCAKSTVIRNMFEMNRFDPNWALPSQMDRNPLVWMISVNGLIVDVRMMPREVQEEALRKGLIPYIPGEEVARASDEDSGVRPAPTTALAYQLKITLKDVRPPIWRRIRMPDCTLEDLHDYIQTAMGWGNSHMHHFKIAGTYYSDTRDQDFGNPDDGDSTTLRLSDLAPAGSKKKVRFEYEYDFGDGWRHEILVERVEEGKAKPECLAGARACPPEDCGGPWGYPDFLAAVADPKHENHDDMVEWIGGSFDPEAFDPKVTTQRMQRGLPSWR